MPINGILGQLAVDVIASTGIARNVISVERNERLI